MASTHDLTVLKAIAHPLRNRILGELSAQGPLRAADVARTLDIPANQASFHLRQLARYGLVEEAVGEGRDRRDRVWRPVADQISLDLRELEEQPGGEAAVAVFHRQAAAWAHRAVDAAYSPTREEGIARTVTDQTLRLTRDEAHALSAELNEVLRSWVERTRGRGGTGRTYLYLGLLQPYPEDAAGPTATSPGS